jgi:hypothetical protein
MPSHMRAQPKLPHSKLQRARKALKAAVVKGAKDAAKLRDGYRCRRCGVGDNWVRIEAAHIIDSGMGGRPSVSSLPSDYVALCLLCHRLAQRSVHSGHVQIVAGPDGGDGPVTFEMVVSTKARSALPRE